jgi:hypothetical protein
MTKRTSRVLFILKFRHGYGIQYHSSGLFNSATMISSMLLAAGIESKVVEVTDNNDIDREVTQYQPTHVIIEALWVVPEKFDVLVELHPSVRWIVRLHSELPFLAQEGMACSWILQYSKHPNVQVAFNSKRILDFFEGIKVKTLYLPNYFPVVDDPIDEHDSDTVINIGCFGALRVLKNQLAQAAAAIEFADNEGKQLRFHINGASDREDGSEILKNLRALFAGTKHTLVEHAWLNPADFSAVLKQIDIGMQVSFSETFNMVSAQMVCMYLPVVLSKEIQWASSLSQADPTSVDDIVGSLRRVTGVSSWLAKKLNIAGLSNYANKSKKIWLHYLQE